VAVKNLEVFIMSGERRALIHPNPSFLSLRDDFFSPLQQEFDQLFNDFFGDFFGQSNLLDKVRSKSGYPKMDISVEDGYYVIRASVSGVAPENLEVEILEKPEEKVRVLRISGKMEEGMSSPEGTTFYRRELKRSGFQREIILPNDIDCQPESSLKLGVLTLRWKLTEQVRDNSPKRVRIPIKNEDA
jgi:HSP20 family molecular chaperone IbpA